MDSNQNKSEYPNKQTALKELDAFVGKWHAEGLSYAGGQQIENPLCYSDALDK